MNEDEINKLCRCNDMNRKMRGLIEKEQNKRKKNEMDQNHGSSGHVRVDHVV